MKSLIIDDSVYDSQLNYSLCHGLGGNCELDLCRQPFRGYFSKSIVYDVGIDGIKKYENAIPYWPCGIQTGQTQDLILGLAGIGYFYLGNTIRLIFRLC